MVSENVKQVSPAFIQFLEDSNNYSQTIENLKHLDLPPEILAQYINFMQTAPISIIFTDYQQRILFTNKTFEYKLQKKQTELIGLLLTDVLTIHLTEEDQQDILLEVIENNHWSGTFSYLNQEGELKKVWLKVSRFIHPNTPPTFGILFFDSENINYRNFASHSLSYYDPKTFLPNFNQFSFDLNQMILKKERDIKGLALIRCQNLSEITAYHSRKMMKEVTMTMIQRIKKELPKGYFLYRLSRDVFALFRSKMASEKEFEIIIERIYHTLLVPLSIDSKKIFLTNEIGVVFYPSQIQSLTQLLVSAEICLNQRDTSQVIYYSETLNKDYTHSIQTVEKLQIALDNNEVQILYRPIVKDNSQVIAAEALLHWNDTELGEISPLAILKGVKEYGHLSRLTTWIFEKIANDKLFIHVPVTVKLDAMQLMDNSLLPNIEQHLKNGTLDATNMILEITEQESLHPFPQIVNRLQKLKSLGFKLAIDNFGAGHTDLSLLTDLEIDILKIDASFVSGVTENPRKEIVLRHLLCLAKELNLVTCFKGITTESEYFFAKKMGTDRFQGRYFSPSLTPTDFIQKYHLK